MSSALEVTGLGVRYRRTWVLRDCSLAVPAGRVAALVGPNGAGKTTLMHTAVGLLRPALGSVRVTGEAAFVAQDKPMYESLTVAEMLAFGRRMNRRWDGDAAAARLAGLGIPLRRKVGRLSGGQQACAGGPAGPARAGRLADRAQRGPVGAAETDGGRGAFWGAPLLGREYERGTHRLAWTQSVPVGRWLAVKLSVLGGAVVAGGLLLSLMVSLRRPVFRAGADSTFGNIGLFNMVEVDPAAWWLYAFALGTVAGSLFRRTLPAMALVVAGVTVTMYTLFRLSDYYAGPARTELTSTGVLDDHDARLVSDAWVEPSGREVADPSDSGGPRRPGRAPHPPPPRLTSRSCQEAAPAT
ncbi:ATP-binding cassette domain-containing protein [Microbispora rosea]|uniref:ATP-binding cassette domain-containing protein n=1 Tax=Microbispora rosea TaxID=58117 RepID=UPI00342D55AC